MQEKASETSSPRRKFLNKINPFNREFLQQNPTNLANLAEYLSKLEKPNVSRRQFLHMAFVGPVLAAADEVFLGGTIREVFF